MSTTRQNRFQSLTHPTSTTSHTLSLHRLKTAFSPVRRSASPSSSTGTTSPLTRTASPDAHGSPSSFRSRSSTHSSIRHLLLLRRKPSFLDLEMEEERCLFGTELGVLEPRPGSAEMGVGVGIEEVLASGGRW